MMHQNTLALILSAFLALMAPGLTTASNEDLAEERKSSDLESSEELLITLEAPLNSPLFLETPVAVVDEEPITVSDLMRRIAATHQDRKMGESSTSKRKNYADLLDRVITTQLIVHEARNIGLDELPDVVENIETVSTELLISKLMSLKLDEVEPDPDKVNELYERMSREYLLSTVKFPEEEDALSFKEQIDSGEDFEPLAKRFAEEGRAEFEADDGSYVKLKDLLPQIAQAVMDMEAGSISEIFSDRAGFLMFQAVAVRSYEDPELKEEARQTALEPAKREVAIEYGEYLQEKHSTVDERLLKKVSFDSKKTGFLSLGKEESVDLKELAKDERVVATVDVDPPFTVTIGDLATAVQEVFYHGIETDSGRKKQLDDEKQVMLKNMLFKRSAVAEAQSLGLDQTDAYLDTMDEFTTSLLFDVFMKRVVAPDVEISEDEVREHFEANIEEFSTPTMLRMNAIAFNELEDAEDALGKLEKRADFKWVSANAQGRVDQGNAELVNFDGVLLSETALPEDLHNRLHDARRGDALIYTDDKGYHHVLVIKEVFPSKPRPYESIRGQAANAVIQQKLKVLVDEWAERLKEEYETRIFVKGLGG